MNMTNVLHRRTTTTSVGDRPTPPTPGIFPPSEQRGDDRPVRWPTGAKVVVAMLAVAALLGLIGSAVGVASGDDGANERQLSDRVASLTAERESAVTAVAELDVELETLRARLQATQADIDNLGDRNGVLGDRVIELEGQVATLTDSRDAAMDRAVDLEADVGALTGERDAALSSAEQVQAALATVQERLTTVTAERDALASRFPVKLDAPLANVITPGKYGVKASEIYCAGLTNCGKAPSFSELTISKTPEGYLRLAIPQFVDGGLFRADGALHLATGSTTAVPACNGVARTATVATTIFPGSYTLDAKGATTIAGLSAVITVQAPATGTCPAVLAFYNVSLNARA